METVIDGAGRLLMPGFVDAHAHADGLLFDPDVQLGLLRHANQCGRAKKAERRQQHWLSPMAV